MNNFSNSPKQARKARPKKHQFVIVWQRKLIRQVWSFTEKLALRQLALEHDLVISARDIKERFTLNGKVYITLKDEL